MFFAVALLAQTVPELRAIQEQASAAAMAACLEANQMGEDNLRRYEAIKKDEDYKKLTPSQQAELQRLMDQAFEENPQEDCAKINESVVIKGELMKEK